MGSGRASAGVSPAPSWPWDLKEMHSCAREEKMVRERERNKQREREVETEKWRGREREV